MKQPTKLLLIILLLTFSACNKKECGECFTPPDMFFFDLVDKTTGENVFSAGTYDPAQIEVKNIEDGSDRAYTFIDENGYNIIQIHSIGWDTETVNVLVSIGDKPVFSLYVDAERRNEECCSFTRYNEVRVENTDYTVDSTTGFYTIEVENGQ